MPEDIERVEDRKRCGFAATSPPIDMHPFGMLKAFTLLTSPFTLLPLCPLCPLGLPAYWIHGRPRFMSPLVRGRTIVERTVVPSRASRLRVPLEDLRSWCSALQSCLHLLCALCVFARVCLGWRSNARDTRQIGPAPRRLRSTPSACGIRAARSSGGAASPRPPAIDDHPFGMWMARTMYT